MPPYAPGLSHRGPGSFDKFTQQPPTSQACTAHCRPVLARLRRPPHQPPFVCADGAGRPASPLGAPSPSHFAPQAFDTSVGHRTIHPSTSVSTRRSMPRLLRPPIHDQIACPDAPRGLSRAAGCSAPCHCFPKSLTTPCRPSAIVLPRHALSDLAAAPATRRCARSPDPDPRPPAQPQTTHRCSSPHATA